MRDMQQIEETYRDETTGVYLRPMTYDDTDDIVAWRNSDSVRRNFIYQAPFTRESHVSWIHNMVETGKVVQMMICLTKTDEAVGSVYLRDIDLTHQKAEYGIFIGRQDCRGRGIGTAAARLMIRYAFREMHLHRLFLRVYADNMQAIGSYERAGFAREAYLREDVCINGKFKDIVLMGVLNEGEAYQYRQEGVTNEH